METLDSHKNTFSQQPPPSGKFSTGELPLLKMVRSAYLIWYGYYQILPKTHRHTLGGRIDSLFITIIEAVAAAGFLPPTEKQPYVQLAIRKQDALKVLLMILWETKSFNDKQYLAVSVPVAEIGQRLGGWHGQITKKMQQTNTKNSPQKWGEK